MHRNNLLTVLELYSSHWIWLGLDIAFIGSPISNYSKNLKVNDYNIYKYENTLIRIYKYNKSEVTEEQNTSYNTKTIA